MPMSTGPGKAGERAPINDNRTAAGAYTMAGGPIEIDVPVTEDDGLRNTTQTAPPVSIDTLWSGRTVHNPVLEDVRSAIAVFDHDDGGRWVEPVNQLADGRPVFDPADSFPDARLVALLPAMSPESLGGRQFTTVHGCRFPYVVGEMARGIATAEMVIAAGRAGLLGFFGSAGLRPPVIAEAIDRIRSELPAGIPWGMNLIHMPDHPQREQEVTDLLIHKKVERVSASAFMQLSSNIVRLSASGLSVSDDGRIQRRTHVFAKVSRPETAETFMAPPPPHMLRDLVAAGFISETQAELQSRLPVAENITIEADSGGHTDNRSLRVVYAAISKLRHAIADRHGYTRLIRLGAAGGLGTPLAIAAAFHLGADYVVTGSINQAAVESGLSLGGRKMLAACGIADVAMAPAADMFERGVKVQVLKKGTMFPMKAQRLYDLYRRYDGLHDLPQKDRAWLEADVLADDCETAWRETRSYYETSNPALAAKADADPKQQMALVFRRYLFLGAKWARDGHDTRRVDYQIWCGPAMGAFNDWVRGSYLEPLENRTVGQIAANLMEGACVAGRAQHLRALGIDVPDGLFHFTPRLLQTD